MQIPLHLPDDDPRVQAGFRQYCAYKEKNTEYIVAVQSGGLYETYGDDAQITCEVLRTRLIERPMLLAGLPTFYCTGFPAEKWVTCLHRLLRNGRSVLLIGCRDGRYEITKARHTDDFIPVGAVLRFDDGRRLRVDGVDFDKEVVQLTELSEKGVAIGSCRESLDLAYDYWQSQICTEENFQLLPRPIQRPEVV